MTRLIGILVIIGIAVVSVLTADSYETKYDDIDVINILENDRLRDQYYECFMDRAPCTTADMKFFKEIIGEALVTKCSKCNERQTEMLNQVTDYYTKNRPEEYKALVEKTVKDLKEKNGE